MKIKDLVPWTRSENPRQPVSNAEQEEAQEDLAVIYAGEPLDIGFNVQYLIDVLTNIKVSDIKLSLEDQNSSALISTDAIENYRYVVMPMRI